MPDVAPRFSTRLWSEEVGMCDPEARSTERDIGYEWSNGRRFRDGLGAYEPTHVPSLEELLSYYNYLNPPVVEAVIVTDNPCFGDITLEAVFVMHTEIEGDITLPSLTLSSGLTYSLYRQFLTNAQPPPAPELLQQFESITAIYEYLYVYDPLYEFIMVSPEGLNYGYSWQTGRFGLPGE